MKGLKLHTRPSGESDAADLASFYAGEHAVPPSLSSPALLVKLLGSIVGHLCFRVDGSILRIEHLYVARELRRKRIGRALLLELEGVAHKRECDSLAVRSDCMIVGYFASRGFEPAEGDVRRIVSG